MAFLMVHLQKVSVARETKMNPSNLAKILGPTIVGYSSMDAQPEEIMGELGVQVGNCETTNHFNFYTGPDHGEVDRDR